jgi:CheY-like chemotaxis protein
VRAREAGRCGQIPALALTAYVGIEDRADAIAAAYQQHAAKAIQSEDLAAGGRRPGRPRGAPEAIVILRTIATTTRGDNADFHPGIPRKLLPMSAKEAHRRRREKR